MMVHLTIQPGGHTPFHNHEWEEEVFVLSGEGKFETKDGKTTIRSGDAVFVDGNMEHQYLNSGSKPLQIICMIPLKGESQ
jgi:quercetin dioxygenase-like cupin family protein